MNTFETLVCFAFTELGHGYVLYEYHSIIAYLTYWESSNAREITTTAQYDTRSGEFIINTPNLLAQIAVHEPFVALLYRHQLLQQRRTFGQIWKCRRGRYLHQPY